MATIEEMVQALMGPQRAPPALTNANMTNYISNTPHLAAQYTPVSNAMANVAYSNSPVRMGQYLPEAAGVADPFGVSAIQRSLGYAPHPMTRLNEAHGLAWRERDKYK